MHCLIIVLLFLGITPFIRGQSGIVDSVLSKISTDSIKLILREISGDTVCSINGQSVRILSRARYTLGHQYAMDYIYYKFVSHGFVAERDTFKFDTNRTDCINIIGTKPGKNGSKTYFIVSAHYDVNDCRIPSGRAPGADDNGSGVTAILEIARVLSKYNFNYTIKFVAFDQEEVGEYGSTYFANQIKSHGDSLLGVINLDMVAFDTVAANKVFIVRPNVSNSIEIGNEFNLSVINSGIPITTESYLANAASDAYAFTSRGYGAISLQEFRNIIKNPNYHKVTDTAGYLNYFYLTNVIKATAVTVIKYATDGTTDVKTNLNGNPSEFILSQNYPNPFNPVTTITYNIPHQSTGMGTVADISVAVYNMLGEKIETLINKKQSAGTYSVNFDGTKYAAGIYFYQLRSGSTILTKRMTLIK